MYELFLLGKLMDRPWHGYEFQQVLNAFVGPMRKASWGTIYPMLRRLQKEGLIELSAAGLQPEDRRGRQSYAITAKGRRAFLERMRPESLNDANYRETFRVMMGNFSRVNAGTRRSLVEAYLERLAAVLEHAQQMTARVQRAPQLRPEERKNILLALEHDRSMALAERKWIRDNVAHRAGSA
jgi:DNA-binding PadR family transcriptional regulator